MAENTSIEWAHHSFNPWIGCTKVGPGCEHCYAEVRDRRKMLGPVSHWGAGAPRHPTSASTWAAPRRWDRRCAEAGIRERVFCASLADVFDNEVPAEWRAELFALIRATPNLDWLLVTKRIGNAAKMAAAAGGWPDNVWLGATIVNQAEAERDIPKLALIEVGVRFLSMEPLLGSVTLGEHLLYLPCPNSLDGLSMDPSTGAYECCSRCAWTGIGDQLAISWIILGGESGPGARPMHPRWPAQLRDQCSAYGIAFFFKQWGEFRPYDDGADAFTRFDPTGQYGSPGDRARHVLAEGEEPGSENIMIPVGKKKAGRKLDGVTHDGVPA